MFPKHIASFFYWLIGGLSIAALYTSYGCASIGAPTGGARDSTAPTLTRAVPENFTPNFSSRTITLNFDEYVELDGVFDKLIINPPLEKFPQVDRKLRTVTVKLKDTLEPNTTYSWRFDDIIRDVNEGNPLGAFTYVFSTGPSFDSASFAGRVLDAKTGTVDSTLLVVLHQNLADSAVEKLKPRYVTKLDGKGFFRFTWLAPGDYRVFALKDDGMKRYTDSSQPFAFHDSIIRVGDNTPPVEMLFFVAREEKPATPAAPAPAKPKQKPADTDEETDKPAKKLKAGLNLSPGSGHDILQDLQVRFSAPTQSIDTTRFLLTDTLFKPVGGFRVIPDTSGAGLLIQHRWKLESDYLLMVLAGAATDSAGTTIAQNDTLRFKTKEEADYGAVKLELAGLDFTQNPVLQLFEGGKLFKSIPMSSPVFTDKLFKPGEYEMRVLLDANKNGVWDTGDYWAKKQPERTLAIGKKLSVRPNWDNELLIDMNAQEEEK